MGKVHPQLDDRLQKWIAGQHLFFVATAPAGGDGLVNLSPKGLDSFAVLGPTEVAYQDLIGSGAETIAHLRENGRITFLFCAFDGPPLILRLYGRGTVVEPGDAGFDALAARFPERPNTRAVIRTDLTRIADSCGYGVPRYSLDGERTQLDDWSARKKPEGLARYQLENNLVSLDGLPALRAETLRKDGGG